MSKHKISRRIPRQPGTKVTYTQEQTDHYKSLEYRLGKAQALIEAIQEIPSDRQGRALYFFPSSRAPERPGGWTVTIDENEPPKPTPPTFSDPTGAPPERLPSSSSPSTVFVARLGMAGYEPGLPPQLGRAVGTTSHSYPSTAIGLPYIGRETPTPPYQIASTIEAINLIKIQAPAIAQGQTLQQLGGGYWISAGKLHFYTPPDSSITALFRYVPLPGQATPAFYAPDPTWRQFLMPPNVNTPLVFDGAVLGMTAYPLGVDPNNPTPTPNPVDPAAPDAPSDPPLPTDPDRAHYECNCPDYTRFELQDPGSEFPSRWRDRTWADSDAGAPVADDGKAYCKHVLAAMLKRGDTLPTIQGES